MQFSRIVAVFVTCFFLANVPTSSACGESLFRIGPGDRGHAYTAPLPGKILIVARIDGARTLADALTTAGHEVHVVNSATELAGELDQSEYDIVLALFSERKLVEAQMVASRATFLPVAAAPEERKLAKQEYQKALSTSDSLKRYLRTIHRALKEAHA